MIVGTLLVSTLAAKNSSLMSNVTWISSVVLVLVQWLGFIVIGLPKIAQKVAAKVVERYFGIVKARSSSRAAGAASGLSV